MGWLLATESETYANFHTTYLIRFPSQPSASGSPQILLAWSKA
jgi:hypothetical protein